MIETWQRAGTAYAASCAHLTRDVLASRAGCARYEVESNERKAGWLAFQAKGAKKKKAGFFSSSGKKKGAKGLHAAVGAKSAGGFTQQPKLTKHVHKAGHAPREGE